MAILGDASGIDTTIGTPAVMDRTLAVLLRTLALGCGCIAVLLALAGFIDFLISGRWPDQSLLRFGYDAELLRGSDFLAHEWGLTVRNLLAAVPASLVLLAAAPLCWMLGGHFANR